MKNYEKDFPLSLTKTKTRDVDAIFNLSDPVARREYFKAKAGPEIEKIKEYFNNDNTFVAYWLGKKIQAKELTQS